MNKNSFLALALLAFVYVCFFTEYQSISRKDSTHIFPLKEELAENLDEKLNRPMEAEEMIEKARSFLKSQGHDLSEAYPSVRFYVNSDLLKMYGGGEERLLSKNKTPPWAEPMSWSVSFFKNAKQALLSKEWYRVDFFADGKTKGVSCWSYAPEELNFSQHLNQEESLELLKKNFSFSDQEHIADTGVHYLGHHLAKRNYLWKVKGLDFHGGHLVAHATSKESFFYYGYDFFHPSQQKKASSRFKDWNAYLGILAVIILASLLLGRERSFDPSWGIFSLSAFLAFAYLFLAWFIYAPYLIKVGIGLAGLTMFGLGVWNLKCKKPLEGKRSSLGVGFYILTLLFSSWLCSDGLAGCTSLCTWIRILIGPLALIFYYRLHRNPIHFALFIGVCPLFLTPHCICDNFANHSILLWWGAAPFCYIVPPTVLWLNILPLSGLYKKLAFAVQILFSFLLLALGLGHVLFAWPW